MVSYCGRNCTSSSRKVVECGQYRVYQCSVFAFVAGGGRDGGVHVIELQELEERGVWLEREEVVVDVSY